MKNLLTVDQMSKNSFPSVKTARSEQQAEPAFFSSRELTDELEERVSEISLSAAPELSHSPEVAPEEFESVYMWFIS